MPPIYPKPSRIPPPLLDTIAESTDEHHPKSILERRAALLELLDQAHELVADDYLVYQADGQLVYHEHRELSPEDPGTLARWELDAREDLEHPEKPGPPNK